MPAATSTPIKISEDISKEGLIAEDILLNPSGDFKVQRQDVDDQSSISSASVMSEDENFDDIFTFDTKTVQTESTDKNNIKSDYEVGNIAENSDSEINSSMEVLDLSGDSDDEDEEFIENFLASNRSEEDLKSQLSEKENVYSFDKESKEVRGRPSACVFVASLSSNLSDDVLCQSVTNHFKQWGEMKLVKVLRDPANRPYAFVQYARDEDADLAISEGQHSILNGRTVRCEKARVNRTLYLEVLNGGICEKTLRKLLSRFGELELLVTVDDNFAGEVINFHPKTKYPRWFCMFIYRQDAISAFANLKSKADWNVEWTQNIEDEYSEVPEITIDKHSIFVGHLDPRISKDDLVERFEQHGTIKEAILVNRPLNNFAFIKFRTKEAAAAAVERENHSMFKYKTIHVQYREMYNNYRKELSAEKKRYKLSLAPPPVNFKRRNHLSNNNHMHNPNHHHLHNQQQQQQQQSNRGTYISELNSYNRKFVPFFPQSDSSNNPTSKLYIPPFKAKTSNQPQRKFESPYYGYKNRRRGSYRGFSKYVHPSNFRQNMYNEGSMQFENDPSQLPQNVNEHDDSIEIQINEPSTAGGDDESTNGDEGDASVMSRAGPKTGYTYSSVDNGELEAGNLHATSNPTSYQYPMYYYYPMKDGGHYMNPPMQHIPNGDYRGQNPNAPNSSNNGYYHHYPNYGPPPSSNTQMPVYPMYVYHPMSMMQSDGTGHPGDPNMNHIKQDIELHHPPHDE